MNPQTPDNCPYCKAKVYSLPCEGDETTYWECGTDYVQEWGFARSSDCYEFELTEKTNEVARLRSMIERAMGTCSWREYDKQYPERIVNFHHESYCRKCNEAL